MPAARLPALMRCPGRAPGRHSGPPDEQPSPRPLREFGRQAGRVHLRSPCSSRSHTGKLHCSGFHYDQRKGNTCSYAMLQRLRVTAQPRGVNKRAIHRICSRILFLRRLLSICATLQIGRQLPMIVVIKNSRDCSVRCGHLARIGICIKDSIHQKSPLVFGGGVFAIPAGT